jgi:O-antigen ligase
MSRNSSSLLNQRRSLQRRESRAESAEIAYDEPEAKPVWRYLEGIIFYGLLVVIALTAIPYGTVEPWSIGLFECAVFALGALWFLTGLFKNNWRLPPLRLLWPLLALLVFLGLQTINFGGSGGGPGLPGALRGTISADPYETQLTLLRLLSLTVAYVLLLGHATSRTRLRALIYLVIGVGVASALFGILRQTTHHNGLGYLLPFLKPNSGYGQFINRNHFAFLMEMSFGLLLGLVIGGGVGRERWLIYVSLAIPLWFALILSNSRGGIFSMLVQVIFAVLMLTLSRTPERRSTAGGWESNVWLRRVRKSIFTRALLMIVLAVAVGLSIIWIGGDRLASRLETISQDANSEAIDLRPGESRREVWRATWSLIKDNPLAGVGFGGYWAVIPMYHDASGILTPQQAHNEYLEILASGGFIGLALCAWFVFVVVKAARAQLSARDGFRRAVCFGALVGLFGVAVHSLFDFGLHFVVVNSLVFVVLIVLAIADVHEPA